MMDSSASSRRLWEVIVAVISTRSDVLDIGDLQFAQLDVRSGRQPLHQNGAHLRQRLA